MPAHTTGPLSRWHQELQARTRKVSDIDDLLRAACAEAAAREERWRILLPREDLNRKEPTTGYEEGMKRALELEAAYDAAH